MRYLLSTFSLILLSACAATGKPFSAQSAGQSDARVYIYRPVTFLQSGVYPTVSIDGKPVGDLKNGGYLTAAVAPGEHVLKLDGHFFQWGHPARTQRFVVLAGKSYFLKLNPTMTTVGTRNSFGYSLKEIPEPAALAELQSLNAAQ